MKRRLLLSAGNPVARIRNSFKNRIAADSGTFEAESCLDSEITRLRNLGLYDKASLIITPNGYKISKLYALKPDSGGDLTFTRASSRTRRNASGLIESLGNNIPALDYPAVGACPLISCQPQRTNSFARSEEFFNSAWSKSSGVTIGADSILSPSNSLTADTLIESSNTGRQGIFYTLGGSSGTFSLSIFAKNYSGNRYLRLVLNTLASTDFVYATFDLVTGTITQQATASSGAVTAISANIVQLINGWYRLTLTGTLTLNYATYALTNSPTSPAGTDFGYVSYTGNGSSGMYIWGAQVETGVNSTSYIPTTTAAVTRIGDLLSASGISSIIGATEGSGYCQFIISEVINKGNNTLMIFESGGSNYMWFRKSGANLQLLTTIGNVLVSDAVVVTAPFVIGVNKVAFAYRAGEKVSLFINGISVLDTSNIVASFTTFNTIGVGASTFGGSELNDSIQALAVFNRRLANSELQSLTT